MPVEEFEVKARVDVDGDGREESEVSISPKDNHKKKHPCKVSYKVYFENNSKKIIDKVLKRDDVTFIIPRAYVEIVDLGPILPGTKVKIETVEVEHPGKEHPDDFLRTEELNYKIYVRGGARFRFQVIITDTCKGAG